MRANEPDADVLSISGWVRHCVTVTSVVISVTMPR